jgi:hypothetical protein
MHATNGAIYLKDASYYHFVEKRKEMISNIKHTV